MRTWSIFLACAVLAGSGGLAEAAKKKSGKPSSAKPAKLAPAPSSASGEPTSPPRATAPKRTPSAKKVPKSPAPLKKEAPKPKEAKEQIPEIDIEPAVPAAEDRRSQAEPQEPAAEPEQSVQRRAFSLGDAGLLADASGSGLFVRQVVPQSFADSLGLRPGDTLLFLDEKPARSAAFISASPSQRMSAVALRGGEVIGLKTSAAPPEKGSTRSPEELTAWEQRLRTDYIEDAGRQTPELLKSLKKPAFHIPAGETLWIRFPKGIPRTVSEGDIIEGEISTPMAMDSSLDYLSVPQGSRVWAQIVASSSKDSTVVVRPHIYKLALGGGHAYPCSALIADVSGDQSLLRVSRGGSIAAAPSDTELYLTDPNRNFQIRFLKPLTIHESADFFKAGVGLWFKTADAVGKGKTFEITHVVDKRSASEAGLKAGDRILAIEGRSVERYSFQQAIGLLYGKPGSSVDLRILRSGNFKGENFSLRRAMIYRTGLGLSVRKEGGSVVVKKVLPDSPAAQARIQEGDILLLLGEADAASLGEAELRAKLREDMTGANAPTFQTPNQKPRKVPLSRESFAAMIEPDIFASGERK
ncbi:MAG: PDZ domain-containing protein [Elusimicrobia bacterium]|nr:PDZ domain-containing protein [Elusimicrobiota bacterium]